MSESQIRIVAHFEVHDGRQADFEKVAKEAVEYADANEPGTLIYDWYVADDGTRARAYELYASSDAVLAHLGGKIVTEMFGPLTQTAKLSAIEVFGPPSDNLVAAAERLPATLYGEAFAGVDR